MTQTPVMNPEQDPKSFTRFYKLTIEKNPTFKVKVFKPPEFDTQIKNYYYYTEVYKPE